jgi:hypothetical protein
MKMRRTVSPWIFGVLGAVSLVAVACGSSAADDSATGHAQLAEDPEASGVLVTDRDTLTPANPGVVAGLNSFDSPF